MSSKATKRICKFEGCGRKTVGRGLCRGHYSQNARGKPLTPLRQLLRPNRRRGTLPQIAFVEVVCTTPGMVGPCQVFLGSRCAGGYMQLWFDGKMVMAHRYCWELVNGPIQNDLEIDHCCRNRACVNVAHLRIVTQEVNKTENSISPWALNGLKTHCPAGHEYTEENIYRYKGRRHCRTCRRLRRANPLQ